jgi:hypothetical protein
MDKTTVLRIKCESLMSDLGLRNFSIAGGFIRDLYTDSPINDLDLFFEDEKSYIDSCEALEYQAKKIKERKNSKVFKLKDGTLIDLVYCNGKTVADTVFNFDILSCCVFFNINDGLISKQGWLDDCEDKSIRLNTITFPYLTLGRISKLKSRGWNISTSEEFNILDYCYKAPWGPNTEFEYNFK